MTFCKIKYQKYKRRSNGSRSYDAPVEWFEGEHEAIIEQSLFDACQEVRAKRRVHYQSTKKYNPYLLRNLIYCYECCSNPPEGKTFRQYGKMRPQGKDKGRLRYYRCRSKDFGCTCEQKGVRVEVIDEQVVAILESLKPPKNWRKGITSAMGEMIGEKNLDDRINEIKSVIERMDKRWDLAFSPVKKNTFSSA